MSIVTEDGLKETDSLLDLVLLMLLVFWIMDVCSLPHFLISFSMVPLLVSTCE